MKSNRYGWKNTYDNQLWTMHLFAFAQLTNGYHSSNTKQSVVYKYLLNNRRLDTFWIDKFVERTWLNNSLYFSSLQSLYIIVQVILFVSSRRKDWNIFHRIHFTIAVSTNSQGSLFETKNTHGNVYENKYFNVTAEKPESWHTINAEIFATFIQNIA